VQYILLSRYRSVYSLTRPLCSLGYALLFYFGSWLLLHKNYTLRDFLIALFGLMLSLNGLADAINGMTDAEKAGEAATRIFELIERESEIDPLSEEGKKQG